MNKISLEKENLNNLNYFVTPNGVTILRKDEPIGSCSIEDFLEKIGSNKNQSTTIKTDDAIHEFYSPTKNEFVIHTFKKPVTISMLEGGSKNIHYYKIKLPTLLTFIDGKEFYIWAVDKYQQIRHLNLPNIDQSLVCWGSTKRPFLSNKKLSLLDKHRLSLDAFLNSTFTFDYIDYVYVDHNKYLDILKKSNKTPSVLMSDIVYDTFDELRADW